MSRVLIASITELCAADHGNGAERLASWTANKTPDGVKAMFAEPGLSLLVGELDGQVAAVGAMIPASGEIALNYVDPGARFRGVSKALLSAMEQQHERGLGTWQAELAEWPGLFLSAHGAVYAMAEAMAGLGVDTGRMRRNIDTLQGLVFAEGASMAIAQVVGKARAHELLEELARRCVESGRPLGELVHEAVTADSQLRGHVNPAEIAALFAPARAAQLPARQARARIEALRAQEAALPPAPWPVRAT